MICFEVKVNGKAICTAGVSELRFLTAAVTWMKQDHEKLCVSVGGMILRDKGEREELRWADEALMPGDEIVIRILDQTAADEPKQQTPSHRDQDRDTRLKIFERLKKEFEGAHEANED